jgi:prepilin-type N-terminal cleavage/methylation domain-containing protein
MMTRKANYRAFTLIELLTVMAIITLLIGILTPAVGAARDKARKTAVRAQINAMEIGLESFAGPTSGVRPYPPSNAVLWATDINDTGGNRDAEMGAWEVGGTTATLQGAHLLVDALVGRDFLGYDPKAPVVGQTNYDRWNPNNDREDPYIPVDGVDVTSSDKPPEDAFGRIVASGGFDPQPVGVEGPNALTGSRALTCKVFRDKFGWPILYYRANPNANQTTPIIQTATGQSYGDGFYDGMDNAGFTSYTQTLPCHRIADASLGLPVAVGTYGQALSNRFAEYIRSFRASTYDTTDPLDIARPRPVKADRFIILSAGKNGIYGDLDDVANFQTQSTER